MNQETHQFGANLFFGKFAEKLALSNKDDGKKSHCW
jgi:hypothetical protein